MNDEDLVVTENIQLLIQEYGNDKQNPLNISKYCISVKKWLLSQISNNFKLDQCFNIKSVELSLKKLKVRNIKIYM